MYVMFSAVDLILNACIFDNCELNKNSRKMTDLMMLMT